ncbi:ABC transporter permease [Nocardia sp. NPDC051833]|uniref:ABC transporter permease n=1 Tax=Nocardia sp. NPDC051833 TaxID=3155674 RepID=UPI003437AC21
MAVTTETLETRAAPISAAPTRQRTYRTLRGLGAPLARVLTAGIGIVAVAALWTAVHAAGIFPDILFPGLGDIAAAGAAMWRDGSLRADTLASLDRVIRGFAVGVLVAIPVGALTATTRAGRLIVQPVLRLFAPVPTVALVPLAILWFGLGEGSKQFVIALGVFVPVWINTHSGLSATPADFLKVARCAGASRWRTLVRVVLPEAFPDIVTGLRVGTATAFVLIVVAEMAGTTVGLGYRIAQAQLFSQVDRMIFCLLVLGVLGVLCDQVVARAAAPFIGWDQEER